MPPDGRWAARNRKSGAWKVVSVSLYERDLELIDAFVEGLRARGHADVGRSFIVRLGLAQLEGTNVASSTIERLKQERPGRPRGMFPKK